MELLIKHFNFLLFFRFFFLVSFELLLHPLELILILLLEFFFALPGLFDVYFHSRVHFVGKFKSLVLTLLFHSLQVFDELITL